MQRPHLSSDHAACSWPFASSSSTQPHAEPAAACDAQPSRRAFPSSAAAAWTAIVSLLTGGEQLERLVLSGNWQTWREHLLAQRAVLSCSWYCGHALASSRWQTGCAAAPHVYERVMAERHVEQRRTCTGTRGGPVTHTHALRAWDGRARRGGSCHGAAAAHRLDVGRDRVRRGLERRVRRVALPPEPSQVKSSQQGLRSWKT